MATPPCNLSPLSFTAGVVAASVTIVNVSGPYIAIVAAGRPTTTASVSPVHAPFALPSPRIVITDCGRATATAYGVLVAGDMVCGDMIVGTTLSPPLPLPAPVSQLLVSRAIVAPVVIPVLSPPRGHASV